MPYPKPTYTWPNLTKAEPIPPDPADHAVDFSRRYAEALEIVAGQAMMDLDIPAHQIGARDPDRAGEHHSFFPGDHTGGSVNHAGQITIDSGVMNPALLDRQFDEGTRTLWRRTRLRPRVEAIIAHEKAEHEYGDHELALIAGAETDLPISRAARNLLVQMERGWQGR